jgi:hypothetical protein
VRARSTRRLLGDLLGVVPVEEEQPQRGGPPLRHELGARDHGRDDVREVGVEHPPERREGVEQAARGVDE